MSEATSTKVERHKQNNEDWWWISVESRKAKGEIIYEVKQRKQSKSVTGTDADDLRVHSRRAGDDDVTKDRHVTMETRTSASTQH